MNTIVGTFMQSNTVVDSFMDNLRSGNFTTSTISVASSTALSSATNSSSGNTTLTDTIGSGSRAEISNISRSSTGTIEINSSIYNIMTEAEIDTKSEKMQDVNNIRIFKKGDVSIDAVLNLPGVKTIIIEDGNLFINRNLTYANLTSSYAFIVKNGNIVIGKDVTKIV